MPRCSVIAAFNSIRFKESFGGSGREAGLLLSLLENFYNSMDSRVCFSPQASPLQHIVATMVEHALAQATNRENLGCFWSL